MKIGFLGAGALGAYYGGRMAETGQEVGFVARNETLEALRTKGLTLIDDNEETSVVSNVASAENFEELAETMGGLDVIINATKSLPGNDSFPDVSGIKTADGKQVPIVTLHNSVEVPQLVAEQYGEENVIPGIVRGYFVHKGPATAQFLPGMKVLNIGTFDRAQDSHAYRVACELTEALVKAGFRSEVWDDIFVEIWSKAMFVTPTGALGALAHQPLGFLREEGAEGKPGLRSTLEGLMREYEAAARAHGVGLPEDIVEKTMALTDKQPDSATSSMQRDIRDGLPNELDAQVGAVRRMAARVGVPTPLHDMMQGALEGQIKAQAEGRQG